MKKVCYCLITLLFFIFPLFRPFHADAAKMDPGKLMFQFRFMEIEQTDYRLNFIEEQLENFDFEKDEDLNEVVMTQLLMLVNDNFEWEEDKIGKGISGIDFSAAPETVYEQLFPAEHSRSYLSRLADDHNREQYFTYLAALQEQYGAYENIIFLGDSRFVGIRDYTGYEASCHFICEIGTGYSWLTGPAYQALLNYRDQLGGDVADTALVINLGVNDLTGGGPFDSLAAGYADFVNQEIVPLGFEVFYMSVNPVNDSLCAASGYSLYNGKVENFNANLQTRLSEEVSWLDTYQWFFQSGLSCSADGLHYPADTNQAILNEALERLRPERS